MKKTLTALSLLSTLSLSAVPAFAQSNGKIVTTGKGNAHQNIIINLKQVTNTVDLDDIQGHWAEKYIKDLVKKGILSGRGNHKFVPNGLVTRAEFATMLARYFNLETQSTTQDFEDVPKDSWEFKYVEATKDYFDAYRTLDGGLVFKPNDGAKRQDVTVALVKVLLKLNPSLQLMDADAADQLLKENFPKDENQIAPALRQYVATAVKYDLIHGYGDGTFGPNRVLNRAEAATLLDRLQENSVVVVGDQTGTSTSTTNTNTNTNTNTASNTTTGSTETQSSTSGSIQTQNNTTVTITPSANTGSANNTTENSGSQSTSGTVQSGNGTSTSGTTTVNGSSTATSTTNTH
ncbi:hypothetical protein DNHGIG_11760 [Collibacillus ludicampi]|uniref:SLH domain-containing protein n=1 Tax=Collibacillus ludicampi TaxID=2771369 RepID=A0AAV4LDY0_9BACL|nr:S-layer homology domain-containing protein [Collibacillus ludicampi]GIM45627.1 hypothetical protein DNHGIG_11760 [Collibacillus ludicampi]